MGDKLGVLWDLDGTLADSEPVHEMAMLAGLRDLDVHAQRGGELVGMDRAGVHAHMGKLYEGVPDYDTYCAAVDRQFLRCLGHVKPFAMARAAFVRWHGEGRGQVVVSNSSWLQVEATLKAIGLFELADGIVVADGKGATKPQPDPYLRGLDLLGCTVDQAIAVEDSEIGCAAARGAGLFVVGLHENGGAIGAHVHFPAMPELTPEEIIAQHG